MLIQRDLGSIPISMGTALALQVSLFGLDPEETIEMELLELKNETTLPNAIYINIETLFRNLYSSLGVNVRDSYLDDKLIPDIQEEMSIITSLISSVTNGKVKVVYYLTEHKSLDKMLPRASLKVPKTKLQLIYQKYKNDTLKYLIEKSDFEINVFNTKVKGNDINAWIMTHHPLDLLSYPEFSKLLLLESHTGKLKPRNEWNTKLTNGNKNFRLPFNIMTIQVMGDNGNLINGSPIKIKRTLLQLAEECKWNSMTTPDKVKSDLKKLEDTKLADYIQSLFYVTLK